MKSRWKYGLPHQLVPRKGLRFLLYLFVILNTALTPVFSPFIAYAFYKDQVSQTDHEGDVKSPKKEKSLSGLYIDHAKLQRKKLTVGANSVWFSAILRLNTIRPICYTVSFQNQFMTLMAPCHYFQVLNPLLSSSQHKNGLFKTVVRRRLQGVKDKASHQSLSNTGLHITLDT